MASFERTRSAVLGPESRPVAIPDDIDRPNLTRATGVIVLPQHLRWSGSPRRYDLANRHDRALVYEQVLAEGNEDDVRRYIDLDELIELWNDLVLPSRVRRAWADWLRRRRHGALPC